MKLFKVLVVCGLAVGLVNCQNKKSGDFPGGGSGNGLQSVYFDYDSSVLRSDGMSAMQANASFMKSNSGASVSVEGHCDERGSNEYNLALGQRCAEASKNYLVNMGVSASRLRAVSYGEEKAVCYEAGESCWQRNRRADFRR